MAFRFAVSEPNKAYLVRRFNTSMHRLGRSHDWIWKNISLLTIINLLFIRETTSKSRVLDDKVLEHKGSFSNGFLCLCFECDSCTYIIVLHTYYSIRSRTRYENRAILPVFEDYEGILLKFVSFFISLINRF